MWTAHCNVTSPRATVLVSNQPLHVKSEEAEVLALHIVLLLLSPPSSFSVSILISNGAVLQILVWVVNVSQRLGCQIRLHYSSGGRSWTSRKWAGGKSLGG